MKQTITGRIVREYPVFDLNHARHSLQQVKMDKENPFLNIDYAAIELRIIARFSQLMEVQEFMDWQAAERAADRAHIAEMNRKVEEAFGELLYREQG